MSALAKTDELFFKDRDLDKDHLNRIVDDTLGQSDDGELFLEYCQSEAFAFDDGRLKTASYDTSQGFGIRSVAGEARGYAHSSDLSESAIKRAADAVKNVSTGQNESVGDHPIATNISLYTDENPMLGIDFPDKVKLLKEIDAYARDKDARIKQVSASLSASWQAVQIIRPGGFRVADIRPLVRLNVSVVVGDGDLSLIHI